MTTKAALLPSLCLLGLIPLCANAQSTPKEAAYKGVDCGALPASGDSEMSACTKANAETKVLSFVNFSSQYDEQAIDATLRSFSRWASINPLLAQHAVVVTTYPQEMARIEAVVRQLDTPRKAFRLTYTVATVEGGKNVGVQHYSMVAVDGQVTAMKEGEKVPIATGSLSDKNAETQTQFTYLDVGMSFDVTLNIASGGVRLKSKVEQSSIGESSTIAGVTEPIVRQSVLEGSALVPLGKPLMLGSIDVANSSRHIDLDVLVEPLN